MKKVKSGKTIKAFRPKFSLQKKIPFSDPDKVAKKLSRSFDEFKQWMINNADIEMTKQINKRVKDKMKAEGLAALLGVRA